MPKQSLGQRTIAKTSRRLLPLIVGIYFAAYLDRTNIGIAALGMNKSLGFSDYLYGWGAGIFFLGYFLFEVPSNIILTRTGARVWIARIMITWGIISGMMALVSGPRLFLVLRFLLGVAEAGFFPGILFYFTLWFPAAYRARVIAVLFLAVPGSNAIGAAISGAILALDGVFNLAGWQWIFIIEAIPAVLLAIAVLATLPDRPAAAKWLTAEESEWLEAELRAEHAMVEETHSSLTLGQTLRDPRVLTLSVIYLTIVTATYGITFFLPLIIHGFGLSNVSTGLVTAIPYLLGTLGMVSWGYSSDRQLERRWHYVIACLLAGAGLIAAGWLNDPTAAVIALSVGAIGLYGAKPVFWPLPSVFLSGQAAAVGLALINSIGNLGGFIGPYMVGWISGTTQSYRMGLWFLAGCALLSGLIGLLAIRLPRIAASVTEAETTFSPFGQNTPQWQWTVDRLGGFVVHAPYRLRALVRTNEIWLTVLAGGIGAATGVVVLLIYGCTAVIHSVLFHLELGQGLSGAPAVDPWRVAVIPAAGGLLLGLCGLALTRWRPRAAADPIEANALYGGRMSVSDSLVVVGQTIWSSGVGASVGLEAAYTQISAAFGSWVGRSFRVRRADMRLLVGCGAAAAIAGAFNGPLTGAFYAFELVIGTYNLASLAPVAAATITSLLVVRLFRPYATEIDLSALGSIGPADCIPIITLGLVCAVVGIMVMRSVTLCEQVFRGSRVPAWLRPCLGGVVVGALALIRPQVLSSGHSSLYNQLPGEFALDQLALLAVLKGLASAISIGSGFRGGLFFASLFLGALVGKFFYGVLVLTTIVRTLPEPAYAVIGMSSVAVAIVGGPLTMAFLALENTGSLPLTFAALAASVVSSLTVRRTFGYSFATWRFHLRGEVIRSAVDVGWMRNLTAGRMMSKEFSFVRADSNPADLRRRFALGSIQRVVVLDQQDHYAGMFLVQDLQALGSDVTIISEILREQPEVLLPQMPVNEIMARFQATETDAMAVVDDLENMHVIGVLTEQFALRRYTEALDRQRRVLSGE
ncbi:MAG: MFS transporter [Rhodopila sp.]|jgi:CIC family chloride channel protein